MKTKFSIFLAIILMPFSAYSAERNLSRLFKSAQNILRQRAVQAYAVRKSLPAASHWYNKQTNNYQASTLVNKFKYNGYKQFSTSSDDNTKPKVGSNYSLTDEEVIAYFELLYAGIKMAIPENCKDCTIFVQSKNFPDVKAVLKPLPGYFVYEFVDLSDEKFKMRNCQISISFSDDLIGIIFDDETLKSIFLEKSIKIQGEVEEFKFIFEKFTDFLEEINKRGLVERIRCPGLILKGIEGNICQKNKEYFLNGKNCSR